MAQEMDQNTTYHGISKLVLVVASLTGDQGRRAGAQLTGNHDLDPYRDDFLISETFFSVWMDIFFCAELDCLNPTRARIGTI